MLQAETKFKIKCPHCKKVNTVKANFNAFTFSVKTNVPEDPNIPISIYWSGDCVYCQELIYDVRL